MLHILALKKSCGTPPYLSSDPVSGWLGLAPIPGITLNTKPFAADMAPRSCPLGDD